MKPLRRRMTTPVALATMGALAGVTTLVGCTSWLDVLSATPDGFGAVGAGGLAAGGEMTFLIKRTGDSREARLVHYAPGPQGGVFGTALQFYDDGVLEWEGFQRFADAVSIGNSYIIWPQRPEADDYYADEEAQTVATPDSLAQATDGEHSSGNIRCEIIENQPPVLYGYHIDVYVDDIYIISIYKGCNECDLFTLDVANATADYYVLILQDWTR